MIKELNAKLAMRDKEISRLNDENQSLKIENKNLNDMINSHFDAANGVPPLQKHESYENECTICVTEILSDRFENNDPKIKLSCVHTSFHNKCLMQWL